MAEFQFLDKRVQKTKQDLYSAFFELLKQKKYVQITIKDIIESAGCSRGTFYTHYNNRDDLLNEIIQFLFKEMTKAYRSSYINKKSINIQSLVDEPLNLLNHFIKYGEYYQLLLGDAIQINFRDRITNLIINLYLEEFDIQSTTDEKKVEGNLLKRYCAYGLVGLILDWIKDDFPIEPKKFSVELVKTFQYSLGTVLIKN
ncbi:TetR/AcrR family transcriptional regulator [Bacillus sp. 1P02SD]|uniref:TetR/AcrR family transcriptional regulator n=1 Tax=Bacillus sp. 1P02SD TaxID=3132264 RepID=UPI0039A11C5B